MLGRAGTLTPPGLRAAIGRAVMEVAPGKAKQRREHATKRTRVERWAEASGNAGLAGRELPPAQVLAADQRVTAWAKELRKARWRAGRRAAGPAFLDILLGMDSRPPGHKPDSTRDPPERGPGTGPGDGRAAGRGDPARIRGAREPHHSRGHPHRAGGPARRARRHRACRPRSRSKYIGSLSKRGGCFKRSAGSSGGRRSERTLCGSSVISQHGR